MALKIKLKYLLLTVLLIITAFSSCKNNTGNKTVPIVIFSSYKDIPGVTEADISAIEAIKKNYNYFIYGMPLSTEAFENDDGEIRGYSALLCEWLSGLFGIPFRPKLYEWLDLLNGLKTCEVSFTGELTWTQERNNIYHMTSDIALRQLKYFNLAGSDSHSEIINERKLKCGFIEGTSTINTVTAELIPGTFETIMLSDVSLVYNALKSGEIDSFFYSNTTGINFIENADVMSNDFYPLIYRPVSLTTQDDALKPIIDVMEKLLENGGLRYLVSMYNQGEHEYLRYKLYRQLTEKERRYLFENPVIPIGVDPGGYPSAFYDRHDKEWKGIFIDLLDEISILTGLTFNIINNENNDWFEVLNMLENREIAVLPDMIQLPERADRFLWPDAAPIADNYALISKNEYPNIKVNEVLYAKVGLVKNTGYEMIFRKWYPNHLNTVEYDSLENAFSALQRGEIDMVMAHQKSLLYLTHYLELPDYKANLVFNYALNSHFGFSKDKETLCSIFSKTLSNIDSKSISDYWMKKTYDYRRNVTQARTPWMIGAAVLFLCVLVLAVIFLVRSRRSGKILEALVEKRTSELKLMEERALAASKSKSEFLANMSHEIRTPMNAILGITEILLINESLSGENREGLNKIYSSCNLLLGIINDILDFSKIEAGKLDIMPAEYKVASMINDSVHLNMMKIGSKQIVFDIQIDENLPAKLIGDELRIKQILNNLLSNAFKYTEAGKITLTVEKEQDINDKDRITLVFKVRDTGCGMNEEQLDKLFEEYLRFDKEKHKTIEGTGLGLTITQKLINLMEGKIHVESKPQEGTLFSVSLKQGIVDSEILGSEVAQNLKKFRLNFMSQIKLGQISREPMPYGNILIVDDVETNIYVASGLMKLYRLQIDSAMSGPEAIKKVKEGREYDIIFMDHMMPEMDGMEAVKQIRAMGYKAPIVALTANAVAGQADIFLHNGFDDFISKPIDIRQLNSILNRLVRDKQPNDVIEAARMKYTNSVINDSGKNKEDAQAQSKSLFLNKEISGINIQGGIQHYEGDEKVFLKILRSYAASVSSMLDDMNNISMDNIMNDDSSLNNYKIKVHGIKGTSYDVFAEQTGKEAKDLEDAAKSHNIDFIREKNESFMVNTRKLMDDIKNLIACIEAEHPKPKKEKPDADILAKLITACNDYSIDIIDEAIEEIEKYQYEADDGLAEWLRDNIDRMDIEKITEKINNLLNK
ncbi:MAG: ATP-binding protein [Treponema sp.]|nr:ATP-binding protein [Treponema sp.]